MRVVRVVKCGKGTSLCYETIFTDYYRVLSDIGQSGFAQVKLGCHLLTRTEVTVKSPAKHIAELLNHIQIGYNGDWTTQM